MSAREHVGLNENCTIILYHDNGNSEVHSISDKPANPLREASKVIGEAWLVLREFNRDNKLVKEESTHHYNLITNSGENLLANLLGGLSSSSIGYIAIGTGTTTPSETDTALSSEVDRKGMDTGYPAVSGSTVTFQSTWTTSEPSGQPYAITELGLFTASSGGTMLNRIVFSPVNKTSSVELTVIVRITFE